MNIANRFRRGSVLLQTLVMCMLLAFISVSITRWVLNRYMGATRTARSSLARGTALGGSSLLLSQWGTNWPTNAANNSPTTINGKNMTYSYMSSNGTSVRKVVFSYDEEQ